MAFTVSWRRTKDKAGNKILQAFRPEESADLGGVFTRLLVYGFYAVAWLDFSGAAWLLSLGQKTMRREAS